MGKMQRVKGKVFERKVAKLFRKAYPFLDGIRRSQQGGGAEQSDVTGVPGLWIECQDARAPTPVAKLSQAIRDLGLARAQNERFPIAVTHRTGSRSIEVTLRISDLGALCDVGALSFAGEVTMSLGDFFEVARGWVRTAAGLK